MDETTSALLLRLAGQAPTLLVALVGLVLAAAFWGRRPRPAACVLVASVLLMVVSVGGTLAQNAVMQARLTHDWTVAQTGTALSAVGVGISLLHAVSVALFLAAAFLDRGERRSPGDPPQTY